MKTSRNILALLLLVAFQANADEMQHATPKQLAWARAHLSPEQLQQVLTDTAHDECPHQADHAMIATHVPSSIGSNMRADMRANYESQCLGRAISTARILADFLETGKISRDRTVTCLDQIGESYDWFQGSTSERVYKCAYTAEDMARNSRR